MKELLKEWPLKNQIKGVEITKVNPTEIVRKKPLKIKVKDMSCVPRLPAIDPPE